MLTTTITRESAPNHIVAAWMKEHSIPKATRHVCRTIGVYVADDAPGLFIVANSEKPLVCYEDEDGAIHRLEPLNVSEGEII